MNEAATSQKTTVAISRESRKLLALLCRVKEQPAGAVVEALIRAAAAHYDPGADQVDKTTVDYEKRTFRHEMKSGQVYEAPLSKRSWWIFREYGWAGNDSDYAFDFELERGMENEQS